MPRCAAKSKQSGKRCKRSAAPGYDVCASHGGKSPKGVASPSFKHGRFSDDIPKRLRGHYEDALSDPELIAQREHLAVLVSFIREKLAAMGEASSAELWKAARSHFKDLQAAMKAQDKDEIRNALFMLGQTLENGYGVEQKETQVRALIQESASLSLAEIKRLDKMGQFITAQQGNALLKLLITTVRDHVRDPKTLAAIQAAINRVANRGAC